MGALHYETGWDSGPKECSCTDGVDHDRAGVPAQPTKILGRRAKLTSGNQIEALTTQIARLRAGADPTPRDEAAHWTPGQLWHRLTTATPDDRRRCLEHITEDLETAWNCRANAHDTTVTELRVAALRVGDLAAALREIVNTLGPDRVCTCTGPDCGIRAEAAEALRIAREALTTEVQGG